MPKASLFDEDAREEARLWVDAEIKTSQVRRFFGQIIADKKRFELNGSDSSDDAKAAMAILKAGTAYAAARERNRKEMADFVHHHAQNVRDMKDFRAFVKHFEAIVAWHRVFEEDRKRSGSRGR